MTTQDPIVAALQDLQDQIDSINFTFASSISTGGISASQVNASSLQTLTSQTGSLTVNDGGSIASGQSGYNSGTGFYLGTNGGTAQLSVGNPSGNYMTWDGSALTIAGSITATTGTIGGWTIGSTTLTGGDVTLNSTSGIVMKSSGTYGDVILWQDSVGGSVGSVYANSTVGITIAGSSSSTAINIGSNSMTLVTSGNSLIDMDLASNAILIRGHSATNQGTKFSPTAIFADLPFYPGSGGTEQSTGSISWDSTNSAIKFTGSAVELDHAFYPALSGGGTQTAAYIQAEAFPAILINAAQLHITGSSGGSWLQVGAMPTVGTWPPTTTLPAGVGGTTMSMNGTTVVMPFYHT
ncbi:MAG: hypothetical protein KGL39_42445 [Patescibacteria group bacterium]|nr:hypothetical protein [Patescibacteria group bacterium]